MTDAMKKAILSALCLCLAGFPTWGSGAAGDEFVFDLRAAEHLYNRADFGARRAQLDLAVGKGLEAVVEELLAGPPIPPDPFFALRVGPYDMDREQKNAMLDGAADDDERRSMKRRLRRDDLEQLRDFRGWWVNQMIEGGDPLREKMTLFWHGYFTSAYRDVKSSYEMIAQNRLLREHALGNFSDLLLGVSRDAAMLEYLDSASNVRKHPNENFARELFELFTLGEGNYSEKDIQEAARAFTGWRDRDSEFRFERSRHDFGKKEVFGVTGRLTGSHVIEIVLERDACARYVAQRLIAWFEGAAPDEERLDRYAALLKGGDYELKPFLRELFLDPDFYRDEIVGQRIAGPVEFLVGHARRLGVSPPGGWIAVGADVLGQRLCDPPSVKGWDGGRAWVTTSTLMARGNLAGFLCGEVSLGDLVDGWEPADLALDEDEAMMAEVAPPGANRSRARLGGGGEILKGARLERWSPQFHLASRLERAGATRDEEIVATLCDELLAIEVDGDTREWLRMKLEEERKRLGLGWRLFLDAGEEAEVGLRRLAHVILSLPEAQLH